MHSSPSLDSQVSKEILKHKVVVVGSGFFGLTLAERISTVLNLPVLVLEKRNHIGGNAYSYKDADTNIEIHKYGTHIFHTNNKHIWDYVNRFSAFNQYRHIVESNVKGVLYPIPINLDTLEMVFQKKFSEEDAIEFFKIQKDEFGDLETPNSKSKAISLVGEVLYETFYAGYTKKQWGVDPSELPSEIISRIPVRVDRNPEYFNDEYQGIPVDGYGKLFENMIRQKGITILTDVDFFDYSELLSQNQALIYSGPLDRFFGYCEGRLGWRSVEFALETLAQPLFQNRAVINYPETEIPYTRIHEFKHLHPESAHRTSQTVIAREFSKLTENATDPYYPMNTPEDRIMSEKYIQLAKARPNLVVGGRLGRYQYLDMHMAIGNALNVFNNEIPSLLKRLGVI